MDEQLHDAVVQGARDASFVLLGEASHGTHEFYRARAEITKRLIAEQRCTLVAVEADWPDAYRVNRFVRGDDADSSADEALSDFRRFPSWMWRNADVAEFVTWLREYNDGLPAGGRKVGFYGLDLYSIYTSMDEVVRYLDEIDASAARRARERYACFGHFGRDPHTYARQTGLHGVESCERAAVEQLVELRRIAAQAALGDGGCLDEDRRFYTEQNARLVVDAERHYRAVFRGGQDSWNLRDQHMAHTLEELVAHASRNGATAPATAVVWEHNSHVGDARATDLREVGQLNVGQLMRERHGDRAFIAGFTTYTGTVTAASDWGASAERKHVRPALPDSWEDVFHEFGRAAFAVPASELEGEALERAIGVVYRPQTELLSHYFHARAGEQFDMVVHIDETHAVEPLERTSAWERGELPDTYPWVV
jgi:erythromycin esterase-like protein